MKKINIDYGENAKLVENTFVIIVDAGTIEDYELSHAFMYEKEFKVDIAGKEKICEVFRVDDCDELRVFILEEIVKK